MTLKLATALVVALAFAGPAAACVHPRTSLAYLEGQIMCPTCHTTLDQSDSDSARQIKTYIRKRIGECATAAQIKSEVVANYGQGILAAPSHTGFDLLAWWLPLGGVIGGAALLAVGVWRWSSRKDSDPVAPLDAATERRIDELLAGLD